MRITDRRLQPAYSIIEAGHHLNVPQATVRYWSTGYGGQPGLINVAAVEPVLLSFINLVELHVLTAIRRKHSVTLPKVRSATDYLARKFGSDHPLVEHDFSTDGIDLFISELGEQVNVSRDGQLGLRGMIEFALKRIERDESGFPIKLYPYTRNRPAEAPALIVIDPNIAGGRPVIKGTGVPIEMIATRYKAGESIRELASDYECKQEEIEEAIRCELRAA